MACVPHGDGTVLEHLAVVEGAERGQLDLDAGLAQHDGEQLAGVLAVAEAVGAAPADGRCGV